MSNTGLIAQKQRLKRTKCESHRVNTPRSKIALEALLCENLQKACEACANAAFAVRPHPYLAGVKCRADGACFVPANGPRPGHLTYGHKMLNGYRDVVIRGVHYYVHRLVAEAFHGLCPEGCEIDHINRDRGDNRPENLRWTTRSGNQRNRKIRDESLARYGVSQLDDKKGYTKAYRKYHRDNDPAYREKHNAYRRTRYATDPKFRAQRKAASERWRLKKKAKEVGNGD